MFAEHAAPGLIELFANRARNLDIELSVRSPDDFARLLLTRSVDVTIGPVPANLDPSIAVKPFLNYQVIAVASPDHPVTKIEASVSQLRQQTWLLGPSAAEAIGLVPKILRGLNVAEDHQQIFQSHAAALEEAKRNKGIALTVSFAAAQDIANGDLKKISGRALAAEGVWSALALAERGTPSSASELIRFMTTPRAIQAMLRGAGVTGGRFQPWIHITLWS